MEPETPPTEGAPAAPGDSDGRDGQGPEAARPGLSRRHLLLAGAGAVGVGLAAGAAWRGRRGGGGMEAAAAREAALTGGDTRVALVHCDAYQAVALDRAVARGLELAPPPDVQGKRVVLKPNFVEFMAGRPVTTEVPLLRALVRAFRARGAAVVLVAEGPGHRRDTDEVWTRAGLFRAGAEDGFAVVDLNVDHLQPVVFDTFAAGTRVAPSLLARTWLPRTLLEADLIVSVPKLKTHHWAGCTLGMKNLFGCLPGAKYGWPKNLLHFNGIRRSILELNANIPVGYTVIDGVQGMQGDGPIMGDPVASEVLVMGRSRVAVDVAGATLMGLEPRRLEYLRLAAEVGLGSLDPPRLLGELPASLRKVFAVLPQWEHLRG